MIAGAAGPVEEAEAAIDDAVGEAMNPSAVGRVEEAVTAIDGVGRSTDGPL